MKEKTLSGKNLVEKRYANDAILKQTSRKSDIKAHMACFQEWSNPWALEASQSDKKNKIEDRKTKAGNCTALKSVICKFTIMIKHIINPGTVWNTTANPETLNFEKRKYR